jgi:Uma2 family endonuclease
MTLAEFLPWAEAQDARYEFDGTGPVEMTGGRVGNSQMMSRLLRLLEDRLAGTGLEAFGADAGVRTVGEAVRYPDVVVARPTPADAYWVRDPVVVFEIVSPSSERTDRVVKRLEYEAVGTIRRYVILTIEGGVTDLERGAEGRFVERALSAADTLEMPEISVRLPLSDIYRAR